MRSPFKPYGHDHHDAAVANFRCKLDPARLLATPADELALALGRLHRQSTSGLASVYVVGNEANNLVKIGYADNLKSRFSGLNSGSPVPLRLLHFIHVAGTLLAKRVEGDTHDVLKEHRVRGEWFDVTPEVAAEAIAAVATVNKIRWWTEEEARQLAGFARKTYERHVERARIFGT